MIFVFASLFTGALQTGQEHSAKDPQPRPTAPKTLAGVSVLVSHILVKLGTNIPKNICNNIQWHAKVWEPLVESVKM